jgi:hypothetical protein
VGLIIIRGWGDNINDANRFEIYRSRDRGLGFSSSVQKLEPQQINDRYCRKLKMVDLQ